MKAASWLRAIRPGAVIIAFSLIIGCSSSANEVATRLDLQGTIRERYHFLAENPFGHGLLHEGFIVAIEKTDRQHLELAGGPGHWSHLQRYYDDPAARSGNELFAPAQIDPLDQHLKMVTDDGALAFVSHILAYEPDGGQFGVGGGVQSRMRTRFVYNIHPAEYGGERRSDCLAAKPPVEGIYERGWQALADGLGCEVEAKLKAADAAGQPYTHLLIGAMGWDNDQVESIRRYNALLGHTIEAARTRPGNPGDAVPQFNPLFIGITWPSVWGTGGWFDLGNLIYKLAGYGAKADDADEIGYTYVNWLINGLALNAKAAHPDLRLVVLGHSFGGRIVSRGLFSGHLLKGEPPRPPQHVDLLVGLQAAFSANRFIGGDRYQGEPGAQGPGLEGAPYAPLDRMPTKVVMTWSDNDSANPLAYWASRASHIGGSRGYRLAEQAPAFFEHVETKADAVPRYDLAGEVNRTIMVDASAFVTDHNDVVDAAAGRFLWATIQAFAPAATGPAPTSTVAAGN
jgi:sugar phosphate isomerase/epimerase